MAQLTQLAQHFRFDEIEARRLLGLSTNPRGRKDEFKIGGTIGQIINKPKVDKSGNKPTIKGGAEAPKRKPTGYQAFLKLERVKVQECNFGMGAKEITAECSARWKGLSANQKNYWNQQAAAN